MAGMTIGLTGGIACGKSEVAKLFEARGAFLIDADVLAREVVGPGTTGLAAVVDAFGSRMVRSEGTLDRKKLGELVFSDASKRKILEGILHPRIRALFLSRLAAIRHKDADALVVYVVPLLFESDFTYRELDKIVVVSSPRAISLERILARDGGSRELAEAKINAQLPIEEKEKKADFVIRNDGRLEDLASAVDAILASLHEHG